MKRLILFAVLIGCLNCNQANADDWTTKDTIWQATYLTLHIIDWKQTVHITENPDKFYETNCILGKHPSVGTVNTYFAITAAGHTAISYLLPNPYRRYWQYVTIGLEGAVIGHNFSMGIKMDF